MLEYYDYGLTLFHISLSPKLGDFVLTLRTLACSSTVTVTPILSFPTVVEVIRFSTLPNLNGFPNNIWKHRMQPEITIQLSFLVPSYHVILLLACVEVIFGDLVHCFSSSFTVMAWGMCVLKNGIGAVAGMRDAFCVAVITDTDQIIVFPWNVTTPLIIWKREHIRKSGSIGNLVFLETGRRCRFGPGLLWMYSVTSVSSLRDGLHKYVFCVVCGGITWKRPLLMQTYYYTYMSG